MICILPNTLVENVKNLIEYNVNKPVSNSYSFCLQSFVSCFHESAGYSKFGIIKNDIIISTMMNLLTGCYALEV